MPTRLRPEEVVTIAVLSEKGTPKREIARTLGVTEGLVRYHLRRRASGAVDSRKSKPFKARVVESQIAAWCAGRSEQERPVNVKDLFEYLVELHAYLGSYRSVLRFVRAHYAAPKIRTYRRVETPPGAQTQTDWGEYPAVDLGDGPEALCALVMVLSHSRQVAIVWSRSHDQVSWLHCHNEAYRRLGGIAATNRIDNVKTALSAGAGAWGTIHPTYQAYARTVGFHVDACQPGEANAKGKTEAKVRLSRLLIDVVRERYLSLEDLQARTDAEVERWSRKAICPATGTTVREAWCEERRRLAPLPILPEPFDVAVQRPVYKDCMVHFEGRQYAVPFAYVGLRIEVRGCAAKVQLVHGGKILREYRRGTEERVLLDQSCYEGPATERAIPPPPLGRLGRRLQEILEMPVEKRPLDLYAALAEVAR
jgi:transposase